MSRSVPVGEVRHFGDRAAADRCGRPSGRPPPGGALKARGPRWRRGGVRVRHRAASALAPRLEPRRSGLPSTTCVRREARGRAAGRRRTPVAARHHPVHVRRARPRRGGRAGRVPRDDVRRCSRTAADRGGGGILARLRLPRRAARARARRARRRPPSSRRAGRLGGAGQRPRRGLSRPPRPGAGSWSGARASPCSRWTGPPTPRSLRATACSSPWPVRANRASPCRWSAAALVAAAGAPRRVRSGGAGAARRGPGRRAPRRRGGRGPRRRSGRPDLARVGQPARRQRRGAGAVEVTGRRRRACAASAVPRGGRRGGAGRPGGRHPGTVGQLVPLATGQVVEIGRLPRRLPRLCGRGRRAPRAGGVREQRQRRAVRSRSRTAPRRGGAPRRSVGAAARRPPGAGCRDRAGRDGSGGAARRARAACRALPPDALARSRPVLRRGPTQPGGLRLRAEPAAGGVAGPRRRRARLPGRGHGCRAAAAWWRPGRPHAGPRHARRLSGAGGRRRGRPRTARPVRAPAPRALRPDRRSTRRTRRRGRRGGHWRVRRSAPTRWPSAERARVRPAT